ncbi:hypothetical protein V1264_024767 [Littorina saxatilis]
MTAWAIHASEYCAQLEFPSLSPDLTISAKENTTVTIPFRLVTDKTSCGDEDVPYIYVSHPTETDPPACIFKLIPSGNCWPSIPKPECLCDGSVKGGAVFSKTVTREDSGTWFFTNSDGIARKRNITLNVEYQIINPTSEKVKSSTSATETRSTFTLALHTNKNVITSDVNSEYGPGKNGIGYDGPFGSTMMLGLVVVGANVVTIVIVAVVIVLCLRRRTMKRKRIPKRALPPVPTDMEHDVMSLRRQHRSPVLGDARHTYEIAGRISPEPSGPDNYLTPGVDV